MLMELVFCDKCLALCDSLSLFFSIEHPVPPNYVLLSISIINRNMLWRNPFDQENGITSSKINLSGLGALEADHHAVERQQTRPLRALHAKRGKKEAEQACNKLNLGNLNWSTLLRSHLTFVKIWTWPTRHCEVQQICGRHTIAEKKERNAPVILGRNMAKIRGEIWLKSRVKSERSPAERRGRGSVLLQCELQSLHRITSGGALAITVQPNTICNNNIEGNESLLGTREANKSFVNHRGD